MRALTDVLSELLRKHPDYDQLELAQALEAQGTVISQSTLSRQLKRMGYLKRAGKWRLLAPVVPHASVQEVPPNLLVLRTASGFANAIAVALDGEPLPGQAGTVAGDDTIFVAVSGSLKAAARAAKLRFERSE
jgi:transcriptional regulator of arginine metabolism